MEKNATEELIELVWFLREREQPTALSEIKKHEGFENIEETLPVFEKEGLIRREKDELKFTPEGEERARQLIRSHRIAERLIYDVLGGEFESGACEFEHMKNVGLVDAICTMLGHPRECPHGYPIPEGECCRTSADTVKRAVIPLTELTVGQSGTVAYVYSKNDQQLHIIEGMQIKPGAVIKLHQKQPTFVVEVEDAHIALDEDVAANIQVWLSTCKFVSVPHTHHNRRKDREQRFRREKPKNF